MKWSPCYPLVLSNRGQEAINLAGEIEGGLSAQLTAAGAILDEDILGKLKEIGENVDTDLVQSFESAAPAVNPLKENIIDAQTEIQNLDELLRAIANGVYTVNVDVQTTGIPTQGDIINPNTSLCHHNRPRPRLTIGEHCHDDQ